jgi:hypothetical protein
MKVNVAPSVDQCCDGKEIVDEAGESMAQPRCLGQVAKEEVDGVGGRHSSAAGLDDRDGGMANGSS